MDTSIILGSDFNVDNPKISIIIVTYNAAETLQKCLNSIFNQAYPNIEIIIVDGGSTDGTSNILNENSEKIKYWRIEENKGIYFAMNAALKYSTGGWIYFLGADDELLPEFSTMVIYLRCSATIYYANVYADGAKKLGKLTRYQFAKFGPYHQAIIYPASVFKKYLFDTRYPISADFALTLKLCGDKDFNFEYKDLLIANFNHTGISSTQIDFQFQKEKAKLILDNFGLKTWVRYKLHKFKNSRNLRA